MRVKSLLLLLLALFLTWGGDLFAARQDLAIDIYAVTTAGVPLDGSIPVGIRLTTDEDGEDVFLEFDPEDEDFTDGSLHTNIDLSTVVEGDVPDSLYLWLTIDGEALPQIELNAVPWSIWASRADSCGVCDSLVGGAAGAEGATGPAGATGATGPAGADGAAGAVGAEGATGVAGPVGAEGATGVAGPVGNYVASVTNGAGVTGGDGGSVAAALTLSVDQSFSPTWTGVHTFTPGGNVTPAFINAPLVTTKNGLNISVDGLTIGTGINLATTTNAVSGGENSSDLFRGNVTSDYTAAAGGAATVSGSVMDLSRSLTGTGAGNGVTLSGALLNIDDEITGGRINGADPALLPTTVSLTSSVQTSADIDSMVINILNDDGGLAGGNANTQRGLVIKNLEGNGNQGTTESLITLRNESATAGGQVTTGIKFEVSEDGFYTAIDASGLGAGPYVALNIGSNNIIASTGKIGLGINPPDYQLDIFQPTGGAQTPYIALRDEDVLQDLGADPDKHDIFYWIAANDVNAGGVMSMGISDNENNEPIKIQGHFGVNPVMTTVPAITLTGTKSDGAAGTGSLANGEIVLMVRNAAASVMTILGNGHVGLGNDAPSGPLVAKPPAAQEIAAGNTIADDGCGTIKMITTSGGGAVTTNTTNTFTAPSAANEGCCMNVVNIHAMDNITLDNNANFKSEGGVDVVLTPYDAVRVCSGGITSAVWYQVSPVSVN